MPASILTSADLADLAPGPEQDEPDESRDSADGDSILSPRELEALRNAVDGAEPGDLAFGHEGPGILTCGDGLPRYRFEEGRSGGPRSEERLAWVFDAATRALERRLSDAMETRAEASVTFLKSTRFAEFRETFEVDVRELAMLGFRIAGLPGQGLVALEPEVVERIVEGLMGGAANSRTEPAAGRRGVRPTTQLDLRVCQRLVLAFLSDLFQAWNPSEPLQVQITGADATGVVARSIENSTPVVVALIEVSIGKRMLGMVGIATPRGAVDRLADPTSHDEAAESGQPRTPGPIAEELAQIKVDVDVTIGSKQISVRDLLALGEGDVIFLDPRRDALGRVQGVPKFVGVPGIRNGHKAIRVTEVIDDGD